MFFSAFYKYVYNDLNSESQITPTSRVNLEDHITTSKFGDFNKGYAKFKGHGGPRDLDGAVKLFKSAAGQGSKQAQDFLGYMYSKGVGVRKNLEVSVQWYRKAADQGFIPSKYSLGVAYSFGKGLPQDFGVAAKLFSEAANQGFIPAQFTLGLAYAQGHGVKKDYIKSYEWLTVAAKQEHEDAAKLREIIEEEMTPGQIAEAKRRARNFQFRFKRRLSQ